MVKALFAIMQLLCEKQASILEIEVQTTFGWKSLKFDP